jgi:hypothetical protein
MAWTPRIRAAWKQEELDFASDTLEDRIGKNRVKICRLWQN